EKENSKATGEIDQNIKLLSIDLNNLKDSVDALKDESIELDQEIKNLEQDRSYRTHSAQPTTRITQQINSKKKKKVSINFGIKTKTDKIERVKGKIESYKNEKDQITKDIYIKFQPALKSCTVNEVYKQIGWLCYTSRYSGTIILNSKEIYVEWNPETGEGIWGKCVECKNDIQVGSICECGTVMCLKHTHSCKICKTVVCSSHSIECKVCHEIYCGHHPILKCEYCGELFCDKHIQRCQCGRLMCEKHTLHCEICNVSLCKDHSHVCQICGNNFCVECSGVMVCSSCGKEICKNCTVEKHKFFRKKVLCTNCAK
ncbi:MAG: hypothetical protein ABIH76_03675, partial [Candidatus Bathyarchaeota archaeon]